MDLTDLVWKHNVRRGSLQAPRTWSLSGHKGTAGDRSTGWEGWGLSVQGHGAGGSPSGHTGAGDRSIGWGVGAERPGPRGVGGQVRTVATGHPE